MKTFLSVLLLLPLLSVAQKAPDFAKKDAQFCKDAVEIYGFNSFKSEKYPDAGQENYPVITRRIEIDISNMCNDCDLFKFELEKRKLLQKIFDEYCAMQLACFPDETQTKIVYTLFNSSSKSFYSSTEIYDKSLHSQKQ